MIGALLTKRVMEKNHVAMQEAMDPVALMARWSDDVTLTPMGCEPIRGKEAVLAFERAYADTLDAVHVTLRSVSLAKPWAFGFTNTVVLEDELRVQRKDGRTQTLHEAIILELERGRIAAVRVFLADPDYEKVVLGVE
jgi:hypothetical protein